MNETINKWADANKPTIIKAKMQPGYYRYEILVTYDDNKDGVKL